MDKLHFETPNLAEQNIDRIAELFPGVITEKRDDNGKLTRAVNFELLKQQLSPEVLAGDEAYEFTWVGKKASIVEANRPIRKTLRPCKDESKDWDTTENLYIEGDNLDVLKLLQESYLRKVKMIYIDPPYNTGHDFIYNDRFEMDEEEYNQQIGLFDEEQNKNFRENNESNPRFHSDWCSMMYARLNLALRLLADDGVLFISIDDNEAFNLKEICDEVFGYSNFIAQLAVQLNPRGRNLDLFVAKTHESVLIYAKNYSAPTTMFGVEKDGKMVDEYNKQDSKGNYRAIGLRNRNQAFNPQTRQNLYYPLYVNPKSKRVSTKRNELFTDEVWPDAPDGTKTCWTWMKAKVDSDNELLIAERTGDEWRIFRKDYLLDEEGKLATTLIKSLWIDNDLNNDYGKKSIKELFGSNIMSFPKSPEFLKKLIATGAKNDSIILDFFSGSSTTAHAVMQLNAEDGGHRKFIMVQLPEPCDEKSEAYKAGYKNICEIGKERIRRAGAKIKSEAGLMAQTLDTGFRVFKLDETNMKDVFYSAEEYTQARLDDMISNIKEDRTDLDLLYGCLLEWGLPLSLPHVTETIEDCHVHTVNGGDLIACFDEDIPESVIKKIAERKPLRVVFRDSSFASSPEKINVTEIFKLMAPGTSVRVI